MKAKRWGVYHYQVRLGIVYAYTMGEAMMKARQQYGDNATGVAEEE